MWSKFRLAWKNMMTNLIFFSLIQYDASWQKARTEIFLYMCKTYFMLFLFLVIFFSQFSQSIKLREKNWQHLKLREFNLNLCLANTKIILSRIDDVKNASSRTERVREKKIMWWQSTTKWRDDFDGLIVFCVMKISSLWSFNKFHCKAFQSIKKFMMQ